MIKMITKKVYVTQSDPFAIEGDDGECAYVLAYADTIEEAHQARRAFELVLAPRFTRDEAIATVKARYIAPDGSDETWRAYMRGIRLALEALAAAGMFSDSRCAECRNDHRVMTCESCGKQTMSDKLDAAGIK